MSRKSYLEQACEAVPEFKTLSAQFLRKYTIAGKSESCTRNYLMQISKLVLHFGRSPLDLSNNKLHTKDIAADVKRLNSNRKLSFVIIDFVQLLQDCKEKNIWLSLRNIAEDENLIMIVLSQLKIDYDRQHALKDLDMVSEETEYVTHTYLLDS